MNPPPPPEVSAYFRHMQRRSTSARLKRSTPAQRTEQARRMAQKRWSTKVAK